MKTTESIMEAFARELENARASLANSPGLGTWYVYQDEHGSFWSSNHEPDPPRRIWATLKKTIKTTFVYREKGR